MSWKHFASVCVNREAKALATAARGKPPTAALPKPAAATAALGGEGMTNLRAKRPLELYREKVLHDNKRSASWDNVFRMSFAFAFTARVSGTPATTYR